MIVPTTRALWALGFGILPAALTAIFSEALWLLWAGHVIVVFALLFLDAALILPARRLSVRLAVPARVYTSTRADARLACSHRPWFTVPAIDVLPSANGILEPPEGHVLRFAAGADTAEVSIPIVPRRRGRAAIESVSLRWRGPLGFAQRIQTRAVNGEFAVVPNLPAVRKVALEFFSNDTARGVKVERFQGDGTEFDTLREFAPGMDSRRIDWKSSAKHRKLLQRQFRAERDHQVVIAFDTGRLMSEEVEGLPRVDHAINGALILAYVGLRTGDRVGLFAFDEAERLYLAPQRGQKAFAELQQQTAALEYRDLETNFTLGLLQLTTRLRRRTLIVLFTDFVDSVTAELMIANLGQLGRRHLILFVSLKDPELLRLMDREPHDVRDLHRAAVAHDFAVERRKVFAKLQSMGIHLIDAEPSQVSPNLVRHYLDIKRRELV